MCDRWKMMRQCSEKSWSGPHRFQLVRYVALRLLGRSSSDQTQTPALCAVCPPLQMIFYGIFSYCNNGEIKILAQLVQLAAKYVVSVFIFVFAVGVWWTTVI